MRAYVAPNFRGEDKADGGIRRVVEAQQRWLPHYGIELAENARDCDVAAFHAGVWEDVPAAVPIVAHCHGLYWEGYDWARWALALNRDVIRTMKQADVVTAPSEWVAQALRRGMWCDPVVIYHGIEPVEWPLVKQPKDVPAYVLWNKTRVDAICDPAPVNELAARAVDIKFVSTFGKEASNVAVIGALPYEEAKPYVQNAAVYLATSRETFGIGTLEAMASGVPVLGWAWGGQTEIVEHKKNGYLARVGDYDDLLEGLRYCLARRTALGRAARKRVLAEFTWERQTARYALLYQKLYERERARPRVSVVITNYNLGAYLPKAIKSASACGADEIIVVDDASTEPLPNVEIPDNVKLIKNTANLYLAEALNVGITAACGRYIVSLDADNTLATGALAVLADALDADRSLDIAYGAMRVTSEGDGGGDKSFISPWPGESVSLDEQLRHRNQIPSTAMYRRRVFDRTGGYRRRCNTAEDADFWCRALSLGFTARRVTSAVVFNYTERAASMSHTQADWPWHKWYEWARSYETRSWVAGGTNIPTCEFPLVSVIIPVGVGHERLVLDALDSVQNQSFRYWETVVVNDTGGALPWVHPWARVLETNGRVGAATARNVGLKNSRAPFVVFLDADDWLHRDALDAMYKALQEAGAGNFAYSDWFVGETGEVKLMKDFDPGAVLQQLPYPVTCMYARSDLEKRGVRFDTALDHKGWEDWDFALQVVAAGGMCGIHVAAPLFHYRLGSGTLRDRAYVARDTMKLEIQNKWAAWITGEKENMASGCGCGGRRYVGSASNNGIPYQMPNTQADQQAGVDTVMLEYTGDQTGTRSYIGRVTGNRYRFGDDDVHRVRRVYASDVKYLLEMGFFKTPDVLNSPTVFEPLVAAGPPAQAA